MTGTAWLGEPASRVVAFHNAVTADPNLLGGKGAGLVRMTHLGLPVPPGFVITAECGREYLRSGSLPEQVAEAVDRQVEELEALTNRHMGDPDRPLLVSVRSGAPVSMPGMMDTLLNCGLTAEVASGLARVTGDPSFVESCRERLLRNFATTVRGISAEDVEAALLDVEAPEESDADAVDRAATRRCEAVEELIQRASGSPFPDARGQLTEAIDAVLGSWNSQRARAYRRHKGIVEDSGTAVVVQRMVFGNGGKSSCSGVAFTRDPSTGSSNAIGDVLFDAQGEDVVDGSRDTLGLTEIEARLPEASRTLANAMKVLEGEYRDMCDIEFTVEEGLLWILQTRVGQRSARAAVRLAVALCTEGQISRREALERVDSAQLAAAYAPVMGSVPESVVLARGAAGSPGATVGQVAFRADRAQELAASGPVVLVRPTTSTTDIPGVMVSNAVVTGRGGRTSHAAVVARGSDVPAVCGIGEVTVANDGRSALVAERELEEGQWVSVDGDRGLFILGSAPLVDANSDPALAAFLDWQGSVEAPS